MQGIVCLFNIQWTWSNYDLILFCRFQPRPCSRTNEQDGWCCHQQVKEAVSLNMKLHEDMITSYFVHTQVVRVSGVGLKYLSSTDGCWSQFWASGNGFQHWDQVKGQFSGFSPHPKFWKSKIKKVFWEPESSLRVSAIPTMYIMVSPIICSDALPIELFLPCLPVPISPCRSELQLFCGLALKTAATSEVARGGC